jgi:hypothetical protein
MLTWMADMPHNADWFVERSPTGWLVLTWVVFMGGFVIPLFLLLMRWIKGRPRYLGAVGVLVLVMQATFQFYLVLPAKPEQELWTQWVNVLPMLAIGGLWLSGFLFTFGRGSLLVPNDYNRARAVELRECDEEETERQEAMAHA